MERTLRTICFESLIQLQCLDGYLCGSGIADSRLFLRAPAVSEAGDEVFPFFHFSPNVFRIVPTRRPSNVGAAKRLTPMERSDAPEGSSPPLGAPAAQEEITYGRVFSLVHAASNLYVSVGFSQRSLNDPDCLSVGLVSANEASAPSCAFCFSSRYKMRAEGDLVQVDDEVQIRLAAKPVYFHVSYPRELDSIPFTMEERFLIDRLFRLGSRLTYYELTHGERLSQLKSTGAYALENVSFGASREAGGGAGCSLSLEDGNSSRSTGNTLPLLQIITREHLDEVNGCEESGAIFMLHRYDHDVGRAYNQMAQLKMTSPPILCGVPLVLFHLERGSFLTSSVAPLRQHYRFVAAPLTGELEDSPVAIASPQSEKANTVGGGSVAVQISAEGRVDEIALEALEQEGEAPTRFMESSGKESGGGAIASAAPSASLQSLRGRESANARLQRRITGLLDAGESEPVVFPTFSLPPKHRLTDTFLDTEAVVVEDEGTSSFTEIGERASFTALWMIECEDPTQGGPVKLGSSCYRLKHLYTGLYLAVCGSAVQDMFSIDEERSDGRTTEESRSSLHSADAGARGPSAAGAAAGDPEGLRASLFPPTTFPQTRWFRPTALCLISEPRCRKDLMRSRFVFESMFPTEASYVFEEESLVLRNALTGMLVGTDQAIFGPNIRLTLQFHHRPSDALVISSISPTFQREALFVRQQSILLSRFRDQIQALTVDYQRDKKTLERAAEKGDAAAASYLANLAEETSRVVAETEQRSKLSSQLGDPDIQLLEDHTRRARSDYSGKTKSVKKGMKSFSKNQAVGGKAVEPPHHAGLTALKISFASTSNHDNHAAAVADDLEDEDEDVVEHMHYRYRCLQHTIRLCQRALIALIEFCANCSTERDRNVLIREGVPIPHHQRMLYDVELHRLVFEVLLAPFCLFPHTAEVFRALLQHPREMEDLDHYEGTALLQVAALKRGMERVWETSGGLSRDPSDSCLTNSGLSLPPLPLSGGLIQLDELCHPLHAELHLCCRLAIRLLHWMTKDNAGLSAGWEVYLPYCLELDGRRLHVIEMLHAMFTDNPRWGPDEMKLLVEHFISATKSIPRGTYLRFLGASCSVGMRGFRERQALICQRLLIDHDSLLCHFVVKMNEGGHGDLMVVPHTPNSAPVPFNVFFTAHADTRMIKFVHGQMRLMTRLCFDGCPKLCLDRVAELLPEQGIRLALRFMWSSYSASLDFTRQPTTKEDSLNMLRTQLLRLAFLTNIWPRISHPRRQLRVRAVLFAGSRVSPDYACPFISGIADEELDVLVKQTSLTVLRANLVLMQWDTARNELIESCVFIWLGFLRSKQYMGEELDTLIPVLLSLLDCEKDVVEVNHRVATRRRPTARGGSPTTTFGSPLMSSKSGSADTFGLPLPADLKEECETHRFAVHPNTVPIMKMRQFVCQCLHVALDNEVAAGANEIVRWLDDVFRSGYCSGRWLGESVENEEGGPEAPTGLMGRLLRRSRRGASSAQKHDEKEANEASESRQEGGWLWYRARKTSRRKDGYDEVPSEEDALLEERSSTMRVSEIGGKGEGQDGSAAGLSALRSSPSSHAAHLVTTADVDAYIERVVHRIYTLFRPAHLIPLLMLVTRYKDDQLAREAMSLLVQLTLVQKNLTQQVLRALCLPNAAALEVFDKAHDLSVALQSVFLEYPTYHAQHWEKAIQDIASTLVEPTGGAPLSSPSASTSATKSEPLLELERSQREFEFYQCYTMLNQSKDLGSGFHEMEDALESNERLEDDTLQPCPSDGSTTVGPGTLPPQPSFAAVGSRSTLRELTWARRRALGLWTKLAVATRMIVFRKTIARRRQALGVIDPDRMRYVDVAIHGEFLVHFQVHTYLIRMLPAMPTDTDAYFQAIRCFYVLSLAEGSAKKLIPYVDFFMGALYASRNTHVMCLHIILNILRGMKEINAYLTPKFLLACVHQIERQVSTKLPDPEFVEKLSSCLFTKSSVSVVCRRRMLLLLRREDTLRRLSNPPASPNPPEVSFFSALVNLVCNVCGSHLSVLLLGRGLLATEQICKMIEKRLRRNQQKLFRSCQSYRHIMDGEAASFKLVNPYIRALVALYFTTMGHNTEDDRRRRKIEWMKEERLWNIFRYFAFFMREAAVRIEEESQRGCSTPSSNSGLAGVLLYPVFFLKSVPILLAAYFLNCFDGDYFVKHFASQGGEEGPGGGGSPSRLSTASKRSPTRFLADRSPNAVLTEMLRAITLFAEVILNFSAILEFSPHDLVDLRAAIGVLVVVARQIHLTDEAAQLGAVLQNLCEWLRLRHEELQQVLGEEGGAKPRNESIRSAERSSFFSTGDQDSSTVEVLERSRASDDGEDGSFDVLVRPHFISLTLQRSPYAQHWRNKARSRRASPPFHAFSGGESVVSPGESMWASMSGTAAGLGQSWSPPAAPAYEEDGLFQIQGHLFQLLQKDFELLPSMTKGGTPSVAVLVANHFLLHVLNDSIVQECVRRMLEVMRVAPLPPRTFVGLLHLFHNVLYCSTKRPQLVEAALASKASTSIGAWEGGRAPSSSVSFPSPLIHQVSSYASGLVLSIKDSIDDFKALWEDTDQNASVKSSYAVPIQWILSELGLMEVAISLTAIQGDVVVLESLRVACALLEGGNRRVQKALYTFFISREEFFFQQVRLILRQNLSTVQEINAEHQYALLVHGLQGAAAGFSGPSSNTNCAGSSNLSDLNGDDDVTSMLNTQLFHALRPERVIGAMITVDQAGVRRPVVSADQLNLGWSGVEKDFGGVKRLRIVLTEVIMRVLQLFCEGHFEPLQLYIRSQHDNLHTVNVIHECTLLLQALSRFLTRANFSVVCQGFELLTECCQGPCRANQEALLNLGTCSILMRVLGVAASVEEAKKFSRSHKQSAFSKVTTGISEESLGELRLSISTCVLALVEGSRDTAFLDRLLSDFSLQVVEGEVRRTMQRERSGLAMLNRDSGDVVDARVENPAVEALFQWLIFLKSIQPSVNELDGSLVAEILSSCKGLTNLIGCIEIRRESTMECVYFRIPSLCTSLTQGKKSELLWEVDRTSQATQLADFVQKSDELIFAMEQLHRFRLWVERWTLWRLPTEELGEEAGNTSRWARLSAFSRAAKQFYNHRIAPRIFAHQLEYYEWISIWIAVIVNALLTVIQGRSVEGGKKESWAALTETSGAFLGSISFFILWCEVHKGWIVSFLCLVQAVVCSAIFFIEFVVGFPITLYEEYKQKQRYQDGEAKLNATMNEVYRGLTWKEQASSFFTSFRIQLRVFFLLVALLSVVASPYFAAFNLMLVIYKIDTLCTFIVAITMNGKQLLLTAFLGLIMIYLFSILGFLLFPSEFNPDADASDGGQSSSESNCETLLHCFVYIFSQGLRAGGGVADVMQPWTWESKDLVPRIQYDIGFYVLMNVVFLNIMFGIIIDTFGQMRDEKREKETDMHSKCFICGVSSDTLEKLRPNGFYLHVKEEHNLWMYLYFMHHLRRKDPDELNGQESYVNVKIQNNRLNFFPVGDSVGMMEARRLEKGVDSSEEDEVDEGEDPSTVGAGARQDSANPAALKGSAAVMEDLEKNFRASLKGFQEDSARLKGVLQQLEILMKSGAGLNGLASATYISGSGIPGESHRSHTQQFGGAGPYSPVEDRSVSDIASSKYTQRPPPHH